MANIGAAPGPLGMSGTVITVLGAESTGKTTLCEALVQCLRVRGVDAVMVPEWLRGFCEQAGRTPHVDEQIGIAAEQSRLIAQAADGHDVVIADTSALMTAVYSEFVFGDRSLYPLAEAAHRQADLTLLTSLELAWQADGHQRDGPHVREPVDDLIRQALQRMGVGFGVVAGQGETRTARGLSLVTHLLDAPARARRVADVAPWRWLCERCDDGDCEQHWLPRA